MENVQNNRGIGLTVPLFITFLVLKLTNHITWSWLWVTSPLWIPLAILLLLIAVTAVYLYWKD